MVKKLRSCRRGIQRGVQKHRIRMSELEHDGTGSSKRILISYVARLCWSYLAKVCCSLNLLALQQSPDGYWILCSVKRLLIHYLILAIGLGLLVRNCVVSIHRLGHYGADTITIMCLANLVLCLIYSSATLGSTWSAVETKDVLNSWRSSLRYIEEVTGEKVSCFDSKADNMKVIGCAYIYNVGPLDMALFGIFIDNAPTTCFESLRYVGMVPENPLPDFVWRLLLSPLDLILVLGQAYTAAFSVITLAVCGGIIRLYCNQMR